MYLDQSLSYAPQQSLNISAKLIESIKILQCSAEELERSITREQLDNPAFEVDESEQCLRCGTPLNGATCPNCDPLPADAATGESLSDLADWDEYREQRSLDLAVPSEDEDYDPLSFVRAGDTLPEHLLVQLGAILPWEDQTIAEYLVGSLDSHGYIATEIAEAAEALKVEEERVARVLTALQSLDPPGIGARNLRECLLIQLRVWADRGTPYPLAERLVADYLGELGEHHFLEIGREVGVTSTQVKRAWRFIKANLNPFPAHAFEGAMAPGVDDGCGTDEAVRIKPDVVIRRADAGFEAEVIEERRFHFAVHPTYAALSRQSTARGMNESDREHVRQYASRARFFIDCVRQRWETLRRISEALVELQHDFLDKGVRALRPLTRSELADRVGLHESTVSRATANKYVLLPEGRTIPFDDFFDSSLATKDTLRELIEREDPKRPLSDEDLAALLTERGLSVARRTVAKYRESLRILPSRFRI
ncbi:MAG TPA: RNA polymerase factor sigma-54 [Ktedonobacterales bacterium]|jgi:RNA polymerase sigma-54 factor